MKKRTNPVALGLCLGWGLGMLLGAAFHSMALGSLLGMAAGGAIGACRGRRDGTGGLRNPEMTVGRLADRAHTAFLAYPEAEEPDPTPTIRATVTLRRREGIRVFCLPPSAPQKAAGFR